ncbi:hypothetical protein D3C72_1982010 [compost metagenome]
MALPFQWMSTTLSNALHRVTVGATRAQAFKYSVAFCFTAQKRQMKDEGRRIEVQRWAGVQLVMQRFSLRMHAGQTM